MLTSSLVCCDINLNIVECRVTQKTHKEYQFQNINLNIVECRDCSHSSLKVCQNHINLNIVECRGRMDADMTQIKEILI